jgi:hypothetical protein
MKVIGHYHEGLQAAEMQNVFSVEQGFDDHVGDRWLPEIDRT